MKFVLFIMFIGNSYESHKQLATCSQRELKVTSNSQHAHNVSFQLTVSSQLPHIIMWTHGDLNAMLHFEVAMSSTIWALREFRWAHSELTVRSHSSLGEGLQVP